MKTHNGTSRASLWPLVILASLSISPLGAASQDQSAELREASIKTLRTVLAEEKEWVKVHAAEMLVFNNYPEGVREAFEAELERGPGPKYRIGVWRVLVQAAGNDKAMRQKYLDKIVAAFRDIGGPDRLHAVETLGKLGYTDASAELTAAAEQGEGTFRAYARWAVANSGKPGDEASLAALLDAADAKVRGCVGYALRYFEGILDATFEKLAQAASKEALDSSARVYLLSATYAHAHGEGRRGRREEAKGELLKYIKVGGKAEKNEVCSALAAVGGQPDVEILATLLEDAEVDVRAHAANALLRIERRQFRGLRWLDWAVLVVYAGFMLGVGVYYSRRQTSTEEYFLASRNMNPYIVGISMFATLLSTISYLGTPGEMIKHGPVILCGLLSVPFTYVVVGYLLIPHILRIRVTSAYEILERRLGVQVRLLGSVIFIMTRLVWMALLIYIAAKLMVEMLDWSHDMIPWVVLAAGIIAVVYTALGGLRAVIVTDLFQFVILMAGALVTIALITIKMGGFSWFPTEWAQHWDRQPVFSWNISTRVTMIGAMIATFCWWVCTAGSDQVAIQRYLATRDPKAARRAFLVNAIADVSVGAVLSLVGFALLGFFAANRHQIPDGKNLIADADYLFPRYIANHLPIGFAGLVVAGMFAAAMSSLDSGINSIVTVFSRDFIDRFRKREGSEGDAGSGNVKLAKYLVIVIGIAVVLLSSQVEEVPGNIVEVTNKTNGLFVGPLFGLFFMALFVRRATAFGTVLGAVYGFMTAFAFAYWDKITGAAHSLSFQLIIVSAVVVHIVVGCVLSRIPTRGKSVGPLAFYSLVALLPLAAIYYCLFTWGLEIARCMNWGASA